MTSISFPSGAGAAHDQSGRGRPRPSGGAKPCEHRRVAAAPHAVIARPLPAEVETERREEVWAAELQARFERVSRWRGVR